MGSARMDEQDGPKLLGKCTFWKPCKRGELQWGGCIEWAWEGEVEGGVILEREQEDQGSDIS